MIEPIDNTTIDKISNIAFREYARTYLDIEHDFLQKIKSYGLPFSETDDMTVYSSFVNDLSDRGLTISNDRKSLHCGWLSSSCEACRKGIETATFLISVQCPKNCFFCFNANQMNYDYLLKNTNDVVAELHFNHKHRRPLSDIALTGGEPLCHRHETLAFFHEVQNLYPEAYTRLYTSGAYLDEDLLTELKNAGVNEIRFSIKTGESEKEQALLLEKIKHAKEYIPFVMVEMPVMPDEYELMTHLLIELNSIPIDGINLLELCFPFNNADKFAERGFKLKKRPFRVLYNYWYAGGLPIAGSEEVCLRLLDFVLDNMFSIGVHYCSLENKFTGQVYLRNMPYRNMFPTCVMSQRDSFLKAAKVFGTDAGLIRSYFDKKGLSNYRLDIDEDYLEFPVNYMTELSKEFENIEVGISFYIVEGEQSESLRELRVDLTTPHLFDIENDI